MSHHGPANDWVNDNNMISTTMSAMAGRYDKPVMACEVDLDWQQAVKSKSMQADLITKARARIERPRCVYWEEQA